MRYLLAAGAWSVGLALLFPACGVEDRNESIGADEARRTGGDAALVAPTGEAQSCVQIERWVEQNRAHLPTDYEGLGRLPMSYRLAVFGSLPPATRSALFQTQLARYAAEHPNMSAEQRAALQKARELLTPEWYALPHESPAWQARVGEPRAALQAQATAAFGREEAIRILATIGPEAPTEVPAPFTSPVERFDVPVCQCATVSDACIPGKKCKSGVIPCIWTRLFCGWTLTDPCNGICIG